MLNSAGMIATFPTVFNCTDLHLKTMTARANVAPEPPITIQFHHNGSVQICGKLAAAIPLAYAAALAL